MGPRPDRRRPAARCSRSQTWSSRRAGLRRGDARARCGGWRERYVAPLADRARPARRRRAWPAEEDGDRRPRRTAAIDAAPGPATSVRSPAYRRGAATLLDLAAAGGSRRRSRSAPRPRTKRPSPSRPSRRVWRRAGARSCWCPRPRRCRRPRAPLADGVRRPRRRCSRAATAGRGTGRGSRSRPARSTSSWARGPAVFAPLRDLGLVSCRRESHPAHREDRAPYYHVRDVALARARLRAARSACSPALCPSAEAAALGLRQRGAAARRWPPVEVVRPGPEGRAPRLVRALPREPTRVRVRAAARATGSRRSAARAASPPRARRAAGCSAWRRGASGAWCARRRGGARPAAATRSAIRRGGAERRRGMGGRHRGGAGPTSRRGPGCRATGEILVGGPERRPRPRARRAGPRRRSSTPTPPRVGPASRRGSARSATWMEAVAWAAPARTRDRAGLDARRPGDPGARPRQPRPVPRARARAPGARPGSRWARPVFRVVGRRAARGRARGDLRPITLARHGARGSGRYACSRSSPGGSPRSGPRCARSPPPASSSASRPNRTCRRTAA